MAYNEADCIGNAIACLAESSHEVFVFDHGSSDGTQDIVRKWGVHLVAVDRRTVAFLRIFRYICRWIADHRNQFDWITWLAADEILRPAPAEKLTAQHIEDVASQGFGVIKPLLREFWISDADPAVKDVPDYLERLRYYRERPLPCCPRSWRIALTRMMPHGLHRANHDWPGRPKVQDNGWVLDHYPIRSVAQGRRKIMRDRPHGTLQYQRYLSKQCKNLAKPAANLICAGTDDA